MPPFLPGLQLAELFYREAVRPVLDAEFPGLLHAAALIGSGSEVLGFDTEMSADHAWGPRLFLYLTEADRARHGAAIVEVLRHRLPRQVRGYPTSWTPPTPGDPGSWHMVDDGTGPVAHRVDAVTVRDWVRHYLGFDIGADGEAPIEPADWLSFPQQKLRTIVAGGVFADDARVGLGRMRARLAFYPHDVWLYLMAAQWTRIGQEEHLMGRAGHAGDELGSAVIGARLARDVMALALLVAREYAPYAKWFGTAFARLPSAGTLAPPLRAALASTAWEERARHLAAAYERLGEMHNALGVTEPVDATARPFFGRPFPVVFGDRFSDALRARITDPEVRRIADRPRIGAVDQVSDSTDLLSHPEWRSAVRRLYEP